MCEWSAKHWRTLYLFYNNPRITLPRVIGAKATKSPARRIRKIQHSRRKANRFWLVTLVTSERLIGIVGTEVYQLYQKRALQPGLSWPFVEVHPACLMCIGVKRTLRGLIGQEWGWYSQLFYLRSWTMINHKAKMKTYNVYRTIGSERCNKIKQISEQ